MSATIWSRRGGDYKTAEARMGPKGIFMVGGILNNAILLILYGTYVITVRLQGFINEMV